MSQHKTNPAAIEFGPTKGRNEYQRGTKIAAVERMTRLEFQTLLYADTPKPNMSRQVQRRAMQLQTKQADRELARYRHRQFL